jgi:hypothetical protein
MLAHFASLSFVKMIRSMTFHRPHANIESCDQHYCLVLSQQFPHDRYFKIAGEASRNGSLETQGHPHVTPQQSPQNSPQTGALGVEPQLGLSPSVVRAEPFDMFAGQKLTAEQLQQVRAPPDCCGTPTP